MKRKVLMMALAVLLVASLMSAPMSALASSKTVQILKVSVDGARLRSGPSSEYSIITSLSKGSKVFYAGSQKNSFCYICTSHGKKGYVFRDFLSSYGVAYKSQIYYASKSAKVHKKASSGSSGVTTLSKGQHVLVYQTKGSWAYIKTLGGKGGYVKKSVLKKAG